MVASSGAAADVAAAPEMYLLPSRKGGTKYMMKYIQQQEQQKQQLQQQLQSFLPWKWHHELKNFCHKSF